MHFPTTVLSAVSLAILPQFVAAITPPDYSSYGYGLAWYSNFAGSAGSAPSSNNWNEITGYLNVNDEQEVYSSSTANVQRSGGETLQIVPWNNNGWTSGRLESVYTFTPTPNQYTCVEAQIRFGESSQAQKQGMWPAFWLLGESLRKGTAGWPLCGELDIMEMVDGILTGYGTAHCDVYPGGICNEGEGLRGDIPVPDYEWHTWRLIWNNTPTNWQQQTITWYMDGIEFHQISGSQFSGNQAIWNSLAHNEMYFILNVAVGGDWVSLVLYLSLSLLATSHTLFRLANLV
jgi:beta-glucanase (GH16 family)